MKKQEIKRRKRLVPAGPDNGYPAASSTASYSPQQQAAQTPAFDQSSVSPEPTTALESSEKDVDAPEPRGPVAIDFTNYYGNNSLSQVQHSQTSSLQPAAPSPRKRSLSATLETDELPPISVSPIPHRPNDISSILNPARAQDANIDPSLSNLSRVNDGPSPTLDERPRASPVPQHEKSARKERLKKEAEAMREELARRERELQELDD
jgi:hypothetical protein